MSLTAVERAEDNADQLPDYVNIHSELLDIKFYSKKKKNFIHYSLLFPTDCLTGQQNNL